MLSRRENILRSRVEDMNARSSPEDAGEHGPVDTFQGRLVETGAGGIDPKAHDPQ